jgi:hypothetical protein
MMHETSPPTLDEVLQEFIAAGPAPTAEHVREWINRYPQFAREIIAFATTWIEVDNAPPGDPIEACEIDHVVNQTMSRLQNLLFEEEAAAKTVEIRDFVAAIKAAGHDLESFERAIDVDRSILTCLVERLIQPTTIPGRLIIRIAEILRLSKDAVRNYFAGPPKSQATHRAKQKPTIQQVSFAEAVRSSTLPEQDKMRWLAEISQPEQ